MFKYLEKWERPNFYFGATWEDYYVFLAQNRDSDALSRSNFICGLEKLKAVSENPDENIIVVREKHWACGWIEWIAIHKDATIELETAEKILDKLDGYPVINEDHFSELEYNETCQFWESLSYDEKKYYCKKAGIDLRKARCKSMPDDPNGYLYEFLRS